MFMHDFHDHGVMAGGAQRPAPIVPTVPGTAGGSFVSYDGNTISGTLTGLAHAWVDDAQGLFHTTTDLQVEWTGYYQSFLEGHSASLTPTQRLEAQAQALFLNTGLGALPAARQAVIREDVQREIDAIGGAMRIAQQTIGFDPAAPLTEQSYVDLSRVLAQSPALHELGVQGHGLNGYKLARYTGYTNDAQHTTDTTTRFVGHGPDHNKAAVADFMDDAIMTHLIFPVVFQNGKLAQLNQDGDHEESLGAAAAAANYTLYGTHLLSAGDFAQAPKSKGK